MLFLTLAYGITWTTLVAAYVALQAGALNGGGAVAGVIVQLAAAGPLLAAVITLAVTRGRAGLAALGHSIVRWRVSPIWYAFVLLGVPVFVLTATCVVYGPDLWLAARARESTIATVFPMYLLGSALLTGLAEEPGWRGYLMPWMNARYAPMTAALLASVLWAMWHLPNALFDGEVTEHLLHIPATVVNGLVQAWVFNSTGGSVLLAMLLHGSQNATAGVVLQLLEDSGADVSLSEYYVISALSFGVLVVIVAALTRGRFGRTDALQPKGEVVRE